MILLSGAHIAHEFISLLNEKSKTNKPVQSIFDSDPDIHFFTKKQQKSDSSTCKIASA